MTLHEPTPTIMTVNDPSPRTVPWTAGSADGHARRVGGASRDQPRSSHDPEAPAQSRWQKEDPIPSESCRLHDFGCDNCLCAARRPVHSHRGFCTPRARSAARRRECRVMSLWSLVELALLRWHAHSYRFCRHRHATEGRRYVGFDWRRPPCDHPEAKRPGEMCRTDQGIWRRRPNS